MISDVIFTIFVVVIVALVSFILISIKNGKVHLIHKLYFLVATAFIIWMLALIGVKFTPDENKTLLYIFDAISYVGGPYTSVFSLFVALTFIKGLTRLPKKFYLLLIVPTLSNIMVWTNPLHNLFYKVFSVNASDVVFGPFMFISGIYSYICLSLSIVLMLNFALHSGNSLYTKQAVLFSIGNFIPLVVSTLATFKVLDLSVAATPIAFTGTIVLHGFAIFYFHLLDITPLALQQVLFWISDGYLITNDEGLILNFNHPFYEMIGSQYGIKENMYISSCIKEEDEKGKTAIYNLLTAIDSCRSAGSAITYEQALLSAEGEYCIKKYYMVEITPLIMENKIAGFVIFYKDVTSVKDNMQRLQDSQVRMMEQERLASLGQMVGGIAHNLKTPIMSISGTATAIDNLVEECLESQSDPEVTPDDYREIYAEMRDWLNRTKEACAYMSDIITAVKGQAANMNTSDFADFSADDMIKRVTLLLRHELVASGCKLICENETGCEILIHGDITSMVQVINNLVSNAIDAEKPNGGEIIIILKKKKVGLDILVSDSGRGIPEDVRSRLFKQMITSKGVQGTGLGVFISNSVVKAKFGGHMWFEDNPGGGTVFGVFIPNEYVSYNDQTREGESV